MKLFYKFLLLSDFSVGAGKILFGAGLKVAGLATGNKGLTSAGGALVGAGVATSLGAHLFGKKKWFLSWKTKRGIKRNCICPLFLLQLSELNKKFYESFLLYFIRIFSFFPELQLIKC